MTRHEALPVGGGQPTPVGASSASTLMPGAGHPPERDREQVSFTAAEARVLPFLASYLTLEGIADRLGIRRSTVKTHVVSIYKKLGATTRAQAMERAAAEGLLNGTARGRPEAGARAARR